MVVSEGAINNIMGGMENTAGVRLHSHRHKLKQRFDIVRKLGQGTYGKVQLALNKETGQEVAIKTIKKAKIETEQDLVRIRREIQIMSSVQHPQIIHIYEVFENREKMVLVMEYAAGGELYDYLSERKVLAEEEARRIFRQVASAVYYCHKHKICHRDLKLENILLDLDGNAKIADFGLSNVFDEKQRLDTFCGSPLYASPEIVKGVPYIGPEVDCWSLGVLLYTLVYGAMPFDGSNFRRLVKQITQGDFYEPSTPATASELIRHMLTVQSTERATVEDICNHWWVNEGYSESCFIQAEALANQTPVRLDLLLSLAPKHISSEHMLIQPDDEDISQKSDSDRAPPNLKIPPPPALPDGELDAEPLPIRSHSLGAVPPPGGVSVDLLIEKKKKEKEKKKKESSSKKPPSRPPVEEEKKIKKKEEKSEPEEKRRSVKRETSIEGDRENIKKRDTSTDREKAKKRERSTDIEKEKVKKRDVSGDRERNKKREGSIEVDKDIPKENQVKEIEKKIVKKRESSLTRKASTKKGDEDAAPAPSITSSIDAQKLPEAPVSSKIEPKSEVKELIKPSLRKSITKSPEKKIVAKKPEDSLHLKDEVKDTDKILKETVAKIEKVENLIKKEEEIITPVSSPITSPVSSPITSPVISPSVTSPVVSTHSSLATSPVRSRTGSESSTEAPRTKSESNSRRQSKIFSKAAMFDPALSPQQSISPPPQDKIKKITRPGALNLSDLTKKFEEKPATEKKNKVVTPFKVSDARKAFESKPDKSVTEISKRRTSVDSNGGSGSASPKDALPTSPTKVDKTIANSISKVSPGNKSTNKINGETSPVKKISKSPTKETGRISPVKREKSPRKETSPIKVIPKTITKVNSFSKSKEEIKDKSDHKSEVAKKEPETPVSNKGYEREIPIKQRGDTSDSSDSESEAEKMLKELSEKREKLEMAKKEKMKKVSEGKEAQSPRDMPAIREEAQNATPVPAASGALSPQDKDQKFATLPRGFKSKIEPARAQVPKPLETGESLQDSVVNKEQNDELPSPSSTEKKSFRRLPVVKEVVPIPPEQVLAPTPRTPESERKAGGYSSTYSPKISSVEESLNGEPVRKRTQVGIVLQNRQPTNHYDGKRGSFSDIGSPTPRPEYRTEVQHTIGTPEPRAAPEPQLQRARRERIIPIMLEDDVAAENDVRGTSSRSSVIQPSSSSSSRTSSVSSVPRSSGFGGPPMSATVASSASSDRQKFNQPSPESLKKSRRERIIPIAVEGEGLMTPPIEESRSTEKVRPFHRQGSSQGSFNRGRGFTLDRNESFSSAGEDDDEEEDDGFQILTAESLFSTLLSRVRSLTRKMGGDDSATGVGGMRRGPQPGVNSDTPSSAGSSGTQSGFWSSLYSPPRDLPGRTIPLSRGHSREEDPFVSFGPPLWDRSLSRNTSDSDSVFSEPSGPFSTLPRGWRARRPVREESIVEGDEEHSSFTPSRRHFYSRTLSRDLPIKTGGDGSKRTGNRNSWDPSTSTGTIPRPSATSGSTLPTQYHQESINRITPQRQNLNTTRNSSLGALNNVGSRESPFSTLLNSGEASGRVGGHFEQDKNTFNAHLASSAQNKDKEETRETRQSVQQLKELVNELESVPDDNQEISEKARAKSNIKMLSTRNQVSLQSPKPSKSFTSFQMQHPITNQSGSNPNIVFNITISAPKHQLTQPAATDPTNSQVKTPTKNLLTSKEPLETNTPATKIYNKVTTDTLTGIGPKNTFIPYNRTLSNLSQKNLNTNALKPENPTNDKTQDISSSLQINSSEKLNGFIKTVEKSSDTLKPILNASLTPKLTDINNKSSSVLEPKKYLTAEPYRRGRSEDLRSTIDIVNSSLFLKDSPKSSIKPYGRSKSRDITPTIEAASEKFTQLNSGTLRKISPFEAYRRSKSRELGSAIDLVNNVNEIRMKSPPPTEILSRSDSSVRQFEKVKTSFEKKFEKAKSPPLEFEKAKSPPLELAKAKSPSFVIEILPKEVVDNSINFSKDNKVNFVTDVQKEEEKQAKDSDKSKSVYKIITSKFSRSLSNLGEDKKETKQPKENEEENNEKEDKFKLKRPSIFMKTKMEKSSSKTSLSEIDGKDEEVDKNERKTNKFSYALNKFLGRKVDEAPSKLNKPDSLNLPKKSTSTAIMSDKLKKPPRFRTKKFSKSHENLNRGEDDLDEYDHGTRAKTVMPETVNTDNRTLESATKGICNHLSQIEINITSQIDNISPTAETKPITTNSSVSTNVVPSIASYGLSPALANKRNNKSQQNSNDDSPGSPTEFDSISKKKLSGEFSEDGSVTPTTESGNESALSGLEDIKEVEDESVMDRITRKSYYSRFNEMKRKPKLRRIDSKESMDQQLAAAKARLLQEDEGNVPNTRDTSNSSRTTPQRLMSISPPPMTEGITRRTLKGNVMPRTISLPPEDGLGLYTGGIRSRQEESGRLSRQPSIDPSESNGYHRSISITRDEAIPYRRQLSGNLDESNYKRLSSIGRDDPPFYLRQPSVSRDEQPTFRLPSVVRDETPTYRRLSAAMRDEPQLRRSSVTKDEPSTYHRFSTTNLKDNINDKRLSSIPREDMNIKRLSMNRDENSGYHTLQYRKYVQNEDPKTKRYSSSYSSRDLVGKQNEINEKYNSPSPTSPSISPTISFPKKNPENTDTTSGENYDKSEVFAAVNAAGKAAGEAAAAALSSEDKTQRIPSPLSPYSVSDPAAVKSAREELTRRLTPLTRLSTIGSGDPIARPYRRTVTSGSLPLGQSNANKPSTMERPYRRTTTMDLPPMDSRPRINDTRRVLQEPSRRYSGFRPAENGLDSSPPTTSSSRSPYSTYVLPSSPYSSFHTPPSMNTLLRRSTFYRY